ncbi:MAG: molybdopterin-dependent oxidoreductase [Chloroflexi bacterium]|nr:molybdopterin-dependent oxidoreductase [Chloroflexota bacterium]
MVRSTKKTAGMEQVFVTACNSHCGGRCLLKVHVKDGVITRVETDDEDEPQFRACFRGRAYRQRVYDPNRLKYPMKRVGERGEGKFERISWDEALDKVAGELRRVKDTYGPASILFLQGGADTGVLQHRDLIERLLGKFGGFQGWWGTASFEGGLFATLASYGTYLSGSTRDDLLNSRLIVMWGWDPVVTVQECNTSWYLTQARERGAKVIAVDPRYTDSAATFADQWIPIIPGTDTAMLVAMAYVMITEELHNKVFLDTYTVGFERFRDYVLGMEDGIPKTPGWAEGITGVPAQTITNLARQYATIKPAALVAGIAPGRTAYGEQYHRAAIALAAMTGNIGVHGGWAGMSWQPRGYGGYPYKVGKRLTGEGNPLEVGAPPRKESFPAQGASASSFRIHCTKVADAILKGKSGGYPADYKLAYVIGTNYVNQYLDTNKIAMALKKLEFIVVQEQVMTAMARFADILLPTCTIMEKNDIAVGGGTPMFGYMRKVIEPLHESRSQFEIANKLAEKLGIKGYNDKTEDEWLREFIKGSDAPDYEEFKRKGRYKVKLSEPYVSFKEQLANVGKKPFPTPSGRIELYSQKLAEMKTPNLPPIPKYVEAWESRRDPLSKKYPLQLITSHPKRRAHTQYETLPWLRELVPQAVLINTHDAQARGIQDGDLVRVFNDRGEMAIKAKVTERIMPGVVDIPQGAWYDPDEKGVDRGGCVNVLTRDEPSPAGSFPSNTGLVQVQKY